MSEHEPNRQIAFRAPPWLIERIDRLALAFQKSEGIAARRSVVIRRAVLAGLPQLEDEAFTALTADLSGEVRP